MFVVKSIGFWSLSETIVQLIYHNVSWIGMLYKTDKLDGFEPNDCIMYVLHMLLYLDISWFILKSHFDLFE